MLLDPVADGLAVGDRRLRQGDVELEAGPQAFGDDPQMGVTLAPDRQLAQFRVVLDQERWILLRQLGQRAGELHLVVAVGDVQGAGEHRLRHLRPAQPLVRHAAGRSEHVAGLDRVHAAQRHHVTRFGGRALVQLAAGGGVDAGDLGTVQHLAVLDRAAPHSDVRQLAHMRGVHGLEDLGHRRLAVAEAAARDGGGVVRGLMTQQLQQALHAVIVLAGAEQDRDQQIAPHRLRQVAVNLLLVGIDLLQQLLEQGVVEIRQGLQQLVAGLRLAIGDGARQLDECRRFALAVLVGALAHQIDIAGDLLAVADRHLPQGQRPGREALQGAQDLAHALAGLIHLVDQDDMRDVVIVEELEDRTGGGGLAGLGLDDDDGDVGDHAGVAGVEGELDAAGGVDEGPAVAEVAAVTDGQLGAGATVAGFGGGVTDGIAVLDGTLALNRAGGVQQCFEQAGLAGLVGAEDRGAAGRAAIWSAAFCRS